MSSSDLDLDLDAPQDSSTSARMSDKQRKLLARKDALARLKRSSTRPAPRFLGADPQDDAEGDLDASQDVDFEQWERRDLERRRQRRAGAAPGAGSASSTRESDPVLSHAFDDLFDLGGNNGADDGIRTGEGSTGADVDGTGVDAVDGVDAEGAPAKKRRVVARMDETRLLGPSGFPRLREDLKKVRIKGKGHEMQDLRRVLSTYQLWAHQMYPKTNFRDTLETIEKLCHKRTVQRALKEYRDDEKHGRSNADEAREHDAFDGLGLADPTSGRPAAGADTGPATLPGRADLLAAAGFDDEMAGAFGPAGDGDDEDLFADEEALLAELEAEAHAAASAKAAAGPPPAPATAPQKGRMELVEEDFDEGEDEDAEAEAALREAEALLM